MFCKNCGKKNDDNNTFCTECGAPLAPVTPDPGRKPEKKKSSAGRYLARVNWIGIAGFALAIASVCTYAWGGDTYLYFAVIGVLVNCLALSIRPLRNLRWFATAGLAVCAFMISYIALIVLALAWICMRVYRAITRY